MFDNDLLISITLMILLFLRQISILKKPNKLNYAPIMLSVGFIGGITHFVIHPEIHDIVMLLRESFVPVLLSLLLYLVMNILHQTQLTQTQINQEEFSKVLIEQVMQLKKYMGELEERMRVQQAEDKKEQEEIRTKFLQDIQALDAIQLNQVKFLEKFNEMEDWHEEVSKKFEFFSNTQLPELDEVVHKHIDILRVAEQEHYNQIKVLLSKAIESREDMSLSIGELKENLSNIMNISDTIAKEILKHTTSQLSNVLESYKSQLLSLKSQTEALSTTLYENDSRLDKIKQRSEILLKQMVLSSDKMGEIEHQSTNLNLLFSHIKEISMDVERIKSDYIKSQSQLDTIANEFKAIQHLQTQEMKDEIALISKNVVDKINESLDKLHEHYPISSDGIPQNVQVLAKKAKLKNGYTQLDSEEFKTPQ